MPFCDILSIFGFHMDLHIYHHFKLPNKKENNRILLHVIQNKTNRNTSIKHCFCVTYRTMFCNVKMFAADALVFKIVFFFLTEDSIYEENNFQFISLIGIN